MFRVGDIVRIKWEHSYWKKELNCVIGKVIDVDRYAYSPKSNRLKILNGEYRNFGGFVFSDDELEKLSDEEFLAWSI